MRSRRACCRLHVLHRQSVWDSSCHKRCHAEWHACVMISDAMDRRLSTAFCGSSGWPSSHLRRRHACLAPLKKPCTITQAATTQFGKSDDCDVAFLDPIAAHDV